MSHEGEFVVNAIVYLLVMAFFVLLGLRVLWRLKGFAQTTLELAKERWALYREQGQRAAVYRRLSGTLFELAAAPDFRRAALAAGDAWGFLAPDALRALFAKYRAAFVDFYARRLREGADDGVLKTSLKALVAELAMPPFEADYIVLEAGLRNDPATANPDPTFVQQIQTVEEEHMQRLAGLGVLRTGDPDIREQLIERETNRFRQRLMGLFNEEHPREEN